MKFKIFDKNQSFLFRVYPLICSFFYEKILRLIKLTYKLFSFLLKKTVDVNYLIKKGDADFNLIFTNETYHLKQSKDINNKKFKIIPEGRHKIPDYRIFTIKNGIIKGRTNKIFSSDGRKITNINFQELPYDLSVLFSLENIKLDYFDGSLLVLGVGPIEKNYSHAWTELAARAYATKVSKIKYDYILIDYDTKFVREILKLIGLKVNKIIFSKNNSYIQARKLIYPELINNYKEYFLNGIYVYHRKYIPSWINSLYKEISNKVKVQDLNRGFEKLYISRRNKSERIIVNEEDLKNLLVRQGFKVIYFEDYSVHDQIYIMKCSKKIIGIHGAGLVNINFCNKGTKILELFPHSYQCAFFYMHAYMSNLDYDFYIGEPFKKLWKKSPIMENFYVDIEKIEKFLIEHWK